MTRGEIRRQRREPDKGNKKYLLTNREIEKIKIDATAKAANLAFPLVCGIMGMVMHDKWDFGGKRLKRLMGQMLDQYESFCLGYFTVEDCLQVLKDETGYDLKEMIEEIDSKIERIYQGKVV